MTGERITDENCHDASMTKLNGERTHVRAKPRGTGPVWTECIQPAQWMQQQKKAALTPV